MQRSDKKALDLWESSLQEISSKISRYMDRINGYETIIKNKEFDDTSIKTDFEDVEDAKLILENYQETINSYINLIESYKSNLLNNIELDDDILDLVDVNDFIDATNNEINDGILEKNIVNFEIAHPLVQKILLSYLHSEILGRLDQPILDDTFTNLSQAYSHFLSKIEEYQNTSHPSLIEYLGIANNAANKYENLVNELNRISIIESRSIDDFNKMDSSTLETQKKDLSDAMKSLYEIGSDIIELEELYNKLQDEKYAVAFKETQEVSKEQSQNVTKLSEIDETTKTLENNLKEIDKRVQEFKKIIATYQEQAPLFQQKGLNELNKKIFTIDVTWMSMKLDDVPGSSPEEANVIFQEIREFIQGAKLEIDDIENNYNQITKMQEVVKESENKNIESNVNADENVSSPTIQTEIVLDEIPSQTIPEEIQESKNENIESNVNSDDNVVSPKIQTETFDDEEDDAEMSAMQAAVLRFEQESLQKVQTTKVNNLKNEINTLQKEYDDLEKNIMSTIKAVGAIELKDDSELINPNETKKNAEQLNPSLTKNMQLKMSQEKALKTLTDIASKLDVENKTEEDVNKLLSDEVRSSIDKLNNILNENIKPEMERVQNSLNEISKSDKKFQENISDISKAIEFTLLRFNEEVYEKIDEERTSYRTEIGGHIKSVEKDETKSYSLINEGKQLQANLENIWPMILKQDNNIKELKQIQASLNNITPTELSNLQNNTTKILNDLGNTDSQILNNMKVFQETYKTYKAKVENKPLEINKPVVEIIPTEIPVPTPQEENTWMPSFIVEASKVIEEVIEEKKTAIINYISSENIIENTENPSLTTDNATLPNSNEININTEDTTENEISSEALEVIKAGLDAGAELGAKFLNVFGVETELGNQIIEAEKELEEQQRKEQEEAENARKEKVKSENITENQENTTPPTQETEAEKTVYDFFANVGNAVGVESERGKQLKQQEAEIEAQQRIEQEKIKNERIEIVKSEIERTMSIIKNEFTDLEDLVTKNNFKLANLGEKKQALISLQARGIKLINDIDSSTEIIDEKHGDLYLFRVHSDSLRSKINNSKTQAENSEKRAKKSAIQNETINTSINQNRNEIIDNRSSANQTARLNQRESLQRGPVGPSTGRATQPQRNIQPRVRQMSMGQSSRQPVTRVDNRGQSSRQPVTRVDNRGQSSRQPVTRVDNRGQSSRQPVTRVNTRAQTSIQSVSSKNTSPLTNQPVNQVNTSPSINQPVIPENTSQPSSQPISSKNTWQTISPNKDNTSQPQRQPVNKVNMKQSVRAPSISIFNSQQDIPQINTQVNVGSEIHSNLVSPEENVIPPELEINVSQNMSDLDIAKKILDDLKVTIANYSETSLLKPFLKETNNKITVAEVYLKNNDIKAAYKVLDAIPVPVKLALKNDHVNTIQYLGSLSKQFTNEKTTEKLAKIQTGQVVNDSIYPDISIAAMESHWEKYKVNFDKNNNEDVKFSNIVQAYFNISALIDSLEHTKNGQRKPSLDNIMKELQDLKSVLNSEKDEKLDKEIYDFQYNLSKVPSTKEEIDELRSIRNGVMSAANNFSETKFDQFNTLLDDVQNIRNFIVDFKNTVTNETKDNKHISKLYSKRADVALRKIDEKGDLKEAVNILQGYRDMNYKELREAAIASSVSSAQHRPSKEANKLRQELADTIKKINTIIEPKKPENTQDMQHKI